MRGAVRHRVTIIAGHDYRSRPGQPTTTVIPTLRYGTSQPGLGDGQKKNCHSKSTTAVCLHYSTHLTIFAWLRYMRLVMDHQWTARVEAVSECIFTRQQLLSTGTRHAVSELESQYRGSRIRYTKRILNTFCRHIKLYQDLIAEQPD